MIRRVVMTRGGRAVHVGAAPKMPWYRQGLLSAVEIVKGPSV
jgi:hypothetical protein